MTTKIRKTASETYRNPKSRAETDIRYFETTDGEHAIVWETPCDELNIYRHETIEAARATWRRLRSMIAADGYTQRI